MEGQCEKEPLLKEPMLMTSNFLPQLSLVQKVIESDVIIQAPGNTVESESGAALGIKGIMMTKTKLYECLK